LRVKDLWYRVWVSDFRVKDSELRVEILELRGQSLQLRVNDFMVWDLGFRFEGYKFRA
jgi:hypothetical protein